MSRNDCDNLDFLIKKAAISLIEEDTQLYDILEKNTAIVNPNQEELDKKVYSIINEHFDKNDSLNLRQRKIKRLMFKAAAFIVILLSGFLIPFATVEAFREKVVNFYIEHFDTHTLFVPKDAAKEENEAHITFKVGYVPEGYVEGDEFIGISLYSISFYSTKNKIIDITIYNDETSFAIDTENSEKYNITVRSKSGYIYRKAGSVSLVFKLYENSVVITSNDDSLSNKELIKIAESIK